MTTDFQIKGLPYFPQNELEIHNNVNVWWFRKNFSQSTFNYSEFLIHSNACTLIAILTAAKCHGWDIKFADPDISLSTILVQAIGQSILEGNEIHNFLCVSGRLKHINMTVPEAIKASKLRNKPIEWRCNLYVQDLHTTFYDNLYNELRIWFMGKLSKEINSLYMILIADQRSVLFIVHEESNKITFVDTHLHLNHGAVIAQCKFKYLESFCDWFSRMLKTCYNSKPTCYEITLLYFG